VINPTLRTRTTADVDKQIEKLLRGLGNPQPPLDLRIVRELLSLDRNFYNSEDDGVLRETVSKLKVAGIQVLRRPALLRDAIRKFSLKALYLPDQKRILIDQALPELKHRWSEAHEIGHSVIPWHEGMMLGDDKQTLLPLCHEQMEAEANYAAGQLLFLGPCFRAEALDHLPTIDNVRALAARYGNTATSTLWRFVEEAHRDVPMFALVSGHPHVSRRASTFDPDQPCRYYVQSPAFRLQFGAHTEIHLFGLIARYCGAQRGGMLGQGELTLNDVNQTLHRFDCQTFFNRYDALTLGVWRSVCPISSFS
jgi:hypothetical protein